MSKQMIAERRETPAAGAQPVGTPASILASEEARLLACVHCGFCLPACPTYTHLGDEADSPRGRLLLMRAVAEGRLDPGSEAFTTHIDRCLGCRACETACPSGVEYGHLLERAREAATAANTAAATGSGRLSHALLWVFGSRFLSSLALAGGRLLRVSGVIPLLLRILPKRLARMRLGIAMLGATRPWRGLRRVETRPELPADSRRDHQEDIQLRDTAATGSDNTDFAAIDSAATGGTTTEPAVIDSATICGAVTGRTASVVITDTETRTNAAPLRAPPSLNLTTAPAPRVALLTGCVQAGLFQRVNSATERVLQANGCTLVDTPGQRCCGALHAHGGARATAQALARTNIAAFEAAGVDHIVVNAAGCGAAMKEYGALLEDDALWAERARAFSARVCDLFELLAELGPRPGGRLALRATYDAPCHLHHAQRITRAPLAVLELVTGVELIPLPGTEECCGGAGIYGVLHPELGGRILGKKVAAIRDTGADVVVTPNPGCIMQIGAGLLLMGSRLPVLHPVELLDESYRRG